MILMLEESLAEQKTFFISHIQTEYVLLLKMGQAATEKKNPTTYRAVLFLARS